jgi:hypothetical protein
MKEPWNVEFYVSFGDPGLSVLVAEAGTAKP